MKLLNKELSVFRYFFTRSMIFFFNFMPNYSFFDSFRRLLLRSSGINIGKNVKAFTPISISPKTDTKNITFEDNAFINSGCRFSAPYEAKIKIGKNCLIAPNVSFETVNHGIHYKKDEPRGAILGDIVLKEGVWVGIRSVILQNVILGKGSVVAAGSIVNKNVENYHVVGGVPIKIIKKLNE